MADFKNAIDTILKHEGGWVNNKNDPGGATNFGVSLRFILQELKAGDAFIDFDLDHDGDVDADDVRKMTREDAVKTYEHYFWDRFKYDRIIDQVVATKIFDMCVNMGSVQAHKIVQRAACVAKDDGVLGKASFDVINARDPKDLLPLICEGQKAFYLALIVKKPTLVEFKTGWLYRAGWPFTHK